jgi:hypothetical protein
MTLHRVLKVICITDTKRELNIRIVGGREEKKEMEK